MAKKGRAGAALCIAAIARSLPDLRIVMLTLSRRRLPRSRSNSARPNTPRCCDGLEFSRLHVVDLAGAHAADGLRRAAAAMIASTI